MIEEDHHLSPQEWLAVLVIIGSLLSFMVIAYLYNSPEAIEDVLERHAAMPAVEIEVSVEGAVETPGVYKFRKGIRYEDLWQHVKPLPEADLSVFKSTTKLRQGQTIRVPKAYLTIYLEGAVKNPGPLQLKMESRLEDLISLDIFSEDADLQKLKKRRKLKDQEIVVIPRKKGIGRNTESRIQNDRIYEFIATEFTILNSGFCILNSKEIDCLKMEFYLTWFLY